MDKHLEQCSIEAQLLLLVYEIRKDHPTMGLRDMYYKLQPLPIGRDRFEEFCKRQGLALERKPNYRLTTDSSGVIRFDNLLIDLEINRPYQVWQSDITYFEVNNKFCYLTFIIDAFTRVIVGFNASKSLKTEDTSLPALRMALKARKKAIEGLQEPLIFHSDGGGQYYAKKFLELTAKFNSRNSMCQYPWDNGKAERINGIIKNNYLKHRDIQSFEKLQQELDRSVKLYNSDKPHISLQRKTPIQFEKEYLCTQEN